MILATSIIKKRGYRIMLSTAVLDDRNAVVCLEGLDVSRIEKIKKSIVKLHHYMINEGYFYTSSSIVNLSLKVYHMEIDKSFIYQSKASSLFGCAGGKIPKHPLLKIDSNKIQNGVSNIKDLKFSEEIMSNILESLGSNEDEVDVVERALDHSLDIFETVNVIQ